jgi:aldehyde:ferredoxin oxidoreductase
MSRCSNGGANLMDATVADTLQHRVVTYFCNECPISCRRACRGGIAAPRAYAPTALVGSATRDVSADAVTGALVY